MNKKLFGDLVREGMGDMTLTELSKACDLNISHLSKLINGKTNARPSKTTLRKIADNSNANYEALLEACGYEAEAGGRHAGESDSAVITMAIENLRTATQQMSGDVRLYDSPSDFLDLCDMLYQENFGRPIKVTCSDPQENDFTGVKNAEYFSKARIVIDTEDKTTSCFFVLYYNITKGNRIIPVALRSDGEALFEAGMIPKEYLAERYDNDTSRLFDETYLVQTRFKESAKERLLRAIFGEGGENEAVRYPQMLVGFGFEEEQIQNYDAFILAHKQTLPGEADEIYEALKDTDKISNRVQTKIRTFADPRTETEGPGAIIAYIMREESGLLYEYIKSEDEQSKGYICIDLGETEYDLQDMKTITNDYAKELGVETFGKHLIPYFDYVDGPIKYETM